MEPNKNLHEAQQEFFKLYAEIGELSVIRNDLHTKLQQADTELARMYTKVDSLQEKYKDVLPQDNQMESEQATTND